MNEKDLFDLVCYAFRKPATDERKAAFNKLLTFSTPYAHLSEEDKALTSMVIDTHFEVYWKHSKLKMSGVGYVSSYPEYRGNGGIRQLMTRLLRDNYEAGTAISYLAPFSYAFYGKFGYTYAFDQKIYTLPALEFPKGQKTAGTVSRQTFDEALSALTDIHRRAYNEGSVARSQEVWEYYFIHKSQPYFAIYREHGVAQGYLIYEFSGNTFVIRELLTLSEEAKWVLQRFIYSHAASFEKIKWVATPDEHLEREMIEPEWANIQLKPYMQARIVNLQEFLKVNGTPDFSAQITDEIIPENNMTIGSGTAEKMTIGEFTARVLRENHAILREYF